MPRLNKALKELNVGINTVAEFLQKKGKPLEDASINAKITDEQYDILLKEFGSDKQKKQETNLHIQKRKEKEQQEKAERKAKELQEQLRREAELKKQKEQQEVFRLESEKKAELKVLGKLQEKKSPIVEEKPEIKSELKSEPIQETPETPVTPETPQVINTPEPEKVDSKEEAAPDNVDEAQDETPQQADKQKDETKLEESEEGVFHVATPDPGLNFKKVGFIDLSNINSKTRPDKKSKAERKKEREEKERARQEAKLKYKESVIQELGNNKENADGQKKKRKHITKGKVDINAVANQQKTNPKVEKGPQSAKNNQRPNSQNTPQQGKKSKRKKEVKAELTDEEVAKQVKETLARLTTKSVKSSVKNRKEKRERHRQEMEEEENVDNKVLQLTESYVSGEVSNAIVEEEDKEEDLESRAPIITVMGHVDHGKTSLLDYIRKTNVIAGEAGGITQHIGAYNVKMKDGRHITFLDTPGHEAFTAMRARGAQVTDIAIIIIAADDAIMPQTKEAIAHAQAAGVPMVFAINKIDKPGANPEKIKEQLANMNLLVEDWGGKYQSQEISAKKGIGVDELMDKVLLEAELLDLRANPNRKATGSVIESTLDKGRGYVATVLCQNGTLHQGDIVLAGTHFGRVRAMFNERGQRIEKALPAEPAVILGLNGAPTAGDTFHVMDTEQEARDICNKREQLKREQGLRTMKRIDLNELGRRIALGDFKELNIVVKGDVDGSIEALSDSLIKLSTEKIQVNVIHKAVGQISESDVTLAAASDAIIVGFQVRPSKAARALAEQEGVDIRLYSVIYDTIEEIKSAMEGMLAPETKEEVTANLEVRQVYHITKVGTVAGAFVTSGKVQRSNKVRVIRDGIVIFTGQINALKRFKDDVKEVGVNFECGISIVNYDNIHEGDILETFTEVEVKQKL